MIFLVANLLNYFYFQCRVSQSNFYQKLQCHFNHCSITSHFINIVNTQVLKNIISNWTPCIVSDRWVQEVTTKTRSQQIVIHSARFQKSIKAYFCATSKEIDNSLKKDEKWVCLENSKS